jgi:hypothetical protein
LIKQTKNTDFCKLKAIIFSVFDPENVNNILLWIVASQHIKAVILPKSLESGTSKFFFRFFLTACVWLPMYAAELHNITQ